MSGCRIKRSPKIISGRSRSNVRSRSSKLDVRASRPESQDLHRGWQGTGQYLAKSRRTTDASTIETDLWDGFLMDTKCNPGLQA